MHKVEDNRLETYRQVCAAVTAEISDDEKTLVLKNFFEHGSDQNGFRGDLLLWVKMLLPNSGVPRDFRLRKAQLLKHFGRLFGCDSMTHNNLEKELDIAEALRCAFEESVKLPPQNKSTIYLQDVEDFLKKLETITNDDDQYELLKVFCPKLAPHDLKTIVRMILKEEETNDLNARHVLDAIAIMAYPTYVSKRDLEGVVREYGSKIMQSVRDRQLKGKRYIRFWEICSFILTFVFVYSFLLFLRSMYVDGFE